MLFLKVFLNSLIRLLTGQSPTPERPPLPVSPTPVTSEPSVEVASQSAAPHGPLSTLDTGQPEAVPCIATIREDLPAVNFRSGPGLSYDRVERASGGMKFGVAGVSGPDPDGFPWYWVDWTGGSGWVRSDLVTLSGACDDLTQMAPAEPEAPAEPPPAMAVGRCFLPTPHRVVQGSHSQHMAYDLAAPWGTPFRAAARGVVIRRKNCDKCAPEQPNIHPSSLTHAQRQGVFNDAEWGFGLGSYLIVSYACADLPVSMRNAMDALDVASGFAYVCYAHLSRMDVDLGQRVDENVVLGATGNTGHTSGPSLHLEVRVGRYDAVDISWLHQPVVHPNLMFRENPA